MWTGSRRVLRAVTAREPNLECPGTKWQSIQQGFILM